MYLYFPEGNRLRIERIMQKEERKFEFGIFYRSRCSKKGDTYSVLFDPLKVTFETNVKSIKRVM